MACGAAAFAPATALAADAPARYSLANGCYAVAGTDGKAIADAVRMKATALGRYLLFSKDGTFVTAQEDGTLAPAAEPSPAADFAVEEAGGALHARAGSPRTQPVATVRFTAAEGCAEFPEADLQATGTPAKGATEYGARRRHRRGPHALDGLPVLRRQLPLRPPWHAYGIAVRAAGLRGQEGPAGHSARRCRTRSRTAIPCRRTTPPATRSYVPNQSKDNLHYEGMYYRWVERV